MHWTECCPVNNVSVACLTETRFKDFIPDIAVSILGYTMWTQRQNPLPWWCTVACQYFYAHFLLWRSVFLPCRALYGFAKDISSRLSGFFFFFVLLCEAFFGCADSFSALASIFLLCWASFLFCRVYFCSAAYCTAYNVEENAWPKKTLSMELGIAEKCLEEPKSAQQRTKTARQGSNVHISEVGLLYLWAHSNYLILCLDSVLRRYPASCMFMWLCLFVYMSSQNKL